MANLIFSTRVKELREEAGLSMDQLARELGVSKSRVNMWENNGTKERILRWVAAPLLCGQAAEPPPL